MNDRSSRTSIRLCSTSPGRTASASRSDEVTEISGAERSFTLKQQGKRQDFDYLIIALGAHKMPHKGKEHVLSICGAPQESLRVKERLDALIARGSGRIAVGFGGNPKDTSGVRGGPAFEFLFNVEHLLKKRGLRKRFELTFFAPMPSPGIRMGEKAVAMMDRMLDLLWHPFAHRQEDQRIHRGGCCLRR